MTLLVFVEIDEVGTLERFGGTGLLLLDEMLGHSPSLAYARISKARKANLETAILNE
jgi:hypothetical protein